MANYSYIPLPGSQDIHRPYVRIWLHHPKSHKRTPQILGLLDSGSDICLASKDIALWLGIHFNGDEESIAIETANGSRSYAVKHPLIITTEERQYECPFFFVDGLSPDEPPLLGQQGFFDHFRVCFDWKNKTFELS
jgi:hypothetical protein